MEVKVKLKNAPISAQKCRLIVNIIRDRTLLDSVNILRFLPKKGARILLKMLESLISNAENNHNIDVDSLKISVIYVNDGIKFKRIIPRAKGRSNKIYKRFCHIVIKASDGGRIK
ncbi:50S ribosomal protein L22 [Candidatus Legionella polyplacis]|uniref:Large ribosomal subunit protein uL22 n=1 Tax=Candidatus Legionella polyplacis TaxID=2005262 RepID=A0ABZ2GZ68_9GAMM|nr:50S ribosomal protein L22 [Candidatus Legionella polyplacis]ATW01762.1 50S ribosomal protein L22 [Candidatus Legionella polyplacis]